MRMMWRVVVLAPVALAVNEVFVREANALNPAECALGDTINLSGEKATLEGRWMVDGSDKWWQVESMEFELAGCVSVSRREGSRPFALYGDNRQYDALIFSSGDSSEALEACDTYSLKLTTTLISGEVAISDYTFSVVDDGGCGFGCGCESNEVPPPPVQEDPVEEEPEMASLFLHAAGESITDGCAVTDGSTVYLGGKVATLEVVPKISGFDRVNFEIASNCAFSSYDKTESQGPYFLYGDYRGVAELPDSPNDYLVACDEPYELTISTRPTGSSTFEVLTTFLLFVNNEPNCDFGCGCGSAPEPVPVGPVVPAPVDNNDMASLVLHEAGRTIGEGCAVVEGSTINLGGKTATLEAIPTISGFDRLKFKIPSNCGFSSFQKGESKGPYFLYGDYNNVAEMPDYSGDTLVACGDPYEVTIETRPAGSTTYDFLKTFSFYVIDDQGCDFGCGTCEGSVPVPSPVAPAPVPAPVPSPVAPAPSSKCGISRIYVIEDEDPSALNLEKGYHHLLYADNEQVEDVLYFHNRNAFFRYNIAMETTGSIKSAHFDGFYYKTKGFNKFYFSLTNTKSVSSNRYSKVNGVYLMSGTSTQMVAGDYQMTFSITDSDGQVCEVLDLSFELLANPQKEPLFDSDVIIQTAPFKDIPSWQESLSDDDPNKVLGVDDRQYQNLIRISQVTYFKNLMYVTFEKWGAIFAVEPYTMGKTKGMSLFLDVWKGIGLQGRSLGYGAGSWHSGLRSCALHPDGDNDNGLVYVSAMEEIQGDKEKLKNTYISGEIKAAPLNEDSVVIEFKYENGKGDPSSYRLIFRVEVPIYDHTIRQLSFGRDNPLTKNLDESKLLYVLHGDGSVESSLVGSGQDNNALGKVLRIDPLNGKPLDASRSFGEYDASMNPFSSSDKPGVVEVSDPKNPTFGAVPKEVFALGFRNPHTIAWTDEGELIVGEAARDHLEEVNLVVEGGNYGWPHREGTWNHGKELDKPDGGGGMFYSASVMTPADECPKCNFRYPSMEWGHPGFVGMVFNSVALAGGHVVDNGSELSKGGPKFFFSDFPFTGLMYFSYLEDMRNAKVMSADDKVSELRPADTNKASCQGVDYGSEKTQPVYDMLRSVLIEPYDKYERRTWPRLNIRFGTDMDGTLYISSKETGMIYKVVNSDPNGEFEEINGLLVGEFESLNVEDYSDKKDHKWLQKSSTGEKHLEWCCSDFNNSPGQEGYLRVPIKINTPGTYRFLSRNFGTNGDFWLRFPDASDFFAKSANSIVYPKGSGKAPTATDSGGDNWFRTRSASNADGWVWGADTSNDPHAIYVTFNSAKVYHFEISGRSDDYKIDRFLLYDESNYSEAQATALNNPETKS